MKKTVNDDCHIFRTGFPLARDGPRGLSSLLANLVLECFVRGMVAGKNAGLFVEIVKDL
jgi:hypothetical protein